MSLSYYLKCIVLSGLLILCNSPASADGAPDAERTQLTQVLRQLDALDHQAQDSARQSPSASSRYHFDYARFHEDIVRVRAGIEHYLTPARAQPRDPVELVGDYRAEATSVSKVSP